MIVRVTECEVQGLMTVLRPGGCSVNAAHLVERGVDGRDGEYLCDALQQQRHQALRDQHCDEGLKRPQQGAEQLSSHVSCGQNGVLRDSDACEEDTIIHRH